MFVVVTLATACHVEAEIAPLERMREAIAVSDSRISDVDPIDRSLSGVGIRYGVTLYVTGAEPVSTQTLESVLAAVESQASASAWSLLLYAVDDHTHVPVDVTAAAEELRPGAWVSVGSQVEIFAGAGSESRRSHDGVA